MNRREVQSALLLAAAAGAVLVRPDRRPLHAPAPQQRERRPRDRERMRKAAAKRKRKGAKRRDDVANKGGER